VLHCNATTRDTQYSNSSSAHSTSRHWGKKQYNAAYHNITHLHRLRTRDNSYAPHREHHHLPETCCKLAALVLPYKDINREAHLDVFISHSSGIIMYQQHELAIIIVAIFVLLLLQFTMASGIIESTRESNLRREPLTNNVSLIDPTTLLGVPAKIAFGKSKRLRRTVPYRYYSLIFIDAQKSRFTLVLYHRDDDDGSRRPTFRSQDFKGPAPHSTVVIPERLVVPQP
jgi:hypothetical protein